MRTQREAVGAVCTQKSHLIRDFFSDVSNGAYKKNVELRPYPHAHTPSPSRYASIVFLFILSFTGRLAVAEDNKQQQKKTQRVNWIGVGKCCIPGVDGI